jgi:hypothetical protein
MGRLLCNVGQLVREQMLSLARFRGILTGTENNVPPSRIGSRIDRLGGFSRAFAGMNPDAAEIMAEA